MRVLAIGATGFIGPHVVRRLLRRGHDVAVLHRGRTSAGTAGIMFVATAVRSAT
jgi:uncharacterized protein YbjT (DUF2867 family)